jgi:hypothetical protein
MSTRRIGRRVVSKTQRQNAHNDGVGAQTLVRKVFHYLFPSFFGGGVR